VALLGKFAVAASFGVIYLYSAELFPTEVRNVAMGVATMGARLGGMLAPIVLMTVRWGLLL
jgi:OCT family organic cation transporter-like MFS transporter 4/5